MCDDIYGMMDNNNVMIDDNYRITSNYGRSCINAGSHFVARVKRTVTKLNIQCGASLIINCHQNSLLVSQIINST